ncbi:transketolase family protein [Insolitispirillum peregrinum]|uniref:transketolase family protein n=1 Tax=Insolitispirillum peregrinum TaxID=80876 RepID=UPI003622C784
MRNAFIDSLCELAREREDIVLLCGDLGYSVLERFAEAFPDRYFNVGIAEQNMAGMAAGLAMAGKTVVTYSIANFAVVRCLEQIRNDICYHNGSVIVVSVGTGVAYGSQGYTHHGIEDMAFTRVLPNMTVVSPGDPAETRWAMRHLVERGGPSNLRLGRGGEPMVHAGGQLQAPFGDAIVMQAPGSQVTFLSTGAILPEVMNAAQALKAQGIDVGVLSMPVVAPLDVAAIEQAARTSSLLISAEEHLAEAGFGGAVAEVVASLRGPHARLVRAGIKRGMSKLVGDQNHIRALNGINSQGLFELALAELAPIEA